MRDWTIALDRWITREPEWLDEEDMTEEELAALVAASEAVEPDDYSEPFQDEETER